MIRFTDQGTASQMTENKLGSGSNVSETSRRALTVAGGLVRNGLC